MSRRSLRRKRDVDIFNFSFLDILACVIGLLIFVLTIVVVSGNGSSATASAKMNASDHQFNAAKAAAELAANQRQRIEDVLSQHARDVTEASQDSAVVRSQIARLNDETSELTSESATAKGQLNELQSKLSRGQGSFINPQTQGSAAETVRLRNEITAIELKIAEANHRAVPHEVSFYLPHVRETDRHTLWVEISGDQLWSVDSGDYVQTPIDADSTRYDRRADAAGTSITSFTTDGSHPPDSLAGARADETVIEAVVRPSGFEGFRKLRQWAWEKGFAVNWAPSEGEPITLTRVNHAYQQ
jgi:hypothetical protein